MKFATGWIAPLIAPTRRRLTRADVAPAVVFLALMGVACGAAVHFNRFMFARPAGFLALLLTPWFVWTHAQGWHGLPRGRAAAALACRLLLLGAFALALAEPRTVRVQEGMSVVYALDVSDSVGTGAADASMKFVLETATRKPPKDQAGLLVFGATPAVELPPRETFPFEAMNAQVQRDATDLSRALSVGAALLPEDRQGRMVLISDGADTEGDLTRAIETLQARGITVDTLPITYGFPDEVWLERLVLPRAVKVGETYEAEIVLQSLKGGRGTLTLLENGREIASREVDYNAGPNRHALPIYLREPGHYEYTARITPPSGRDGWKENNVAMGDLFLRGEGRVLLVTDPEGDGRDWQKLAAALREGRRLVDVQFSHELPRDAVSLLPWDAVILVNVPAEQLDTVQMNALKDASFKLGTGVLMVGGKNSYGAGAWNRTPVEDLLPVSMDILQKKVLPKAALAVVLHTCEFPQGNEWGKRITKEAIRVLNKQDDAGVLVYDWGGGGNDGVRWLFDLSPVSGFEKMATAINGASIGDMPDFATTMRMGLAGLKKNDAATKHMIIISDGDPSPPPPELLAEYAANQITITTVSVFPHGGGEVEIMKVIANATKGRYYNVADARQLPGIFIKEAKTLKKNLLQSVDFTPDLGFPSGVMKGIDALPRLHGYVLTTLKPGASPILTRQPEDAEEKDPILASWQFGLGRTAAFTSDLSPNWGKDWVAWDRYRAFVNQLVGDLARTAKESQLGVQAFTEGGKGVVIVEDRHPQAARLRVEGEVTRPDHTTAPLAFTQVGPRVYQAEFPISGQGRYQAMVAAAAPGRTEQAATGFAVPFSKEYLRFRSDPARLRMIAEKTGGRVLTGQETAEDIFGRDRKPRRSTRGATEWFLAALAILIPLDVALRRVQFDWAQFRRGGRGDQARATTGALLQRKVEREAPAPRPAPSAPVRSSIPAPAPSTPSPRPAAPARPAAEPAKPAAPAEEPSTGTSSRLLEMKRRRERNPPDKPQ